MKRTIRYARQPPYKGGRTPAHSAFTPSIEAAIAKEQDTCERQFGLRPSRSFVIATATAFALNVEDQPDYRPSAAHAPSRLERPHLALVGGQKRRRA